MKNPLITILIVNFNSAEFIENTLYGLKKLTRNPYQVFIVDNDSKSKDYEKLQRIISEYENVSLERNSTGLRGSMAHGTALNYLATQVDTLYFSILDADATWLIKDWDTILISTFDDKVKVAGTESDGDKPKDFPLMYAILFETKTFNDLNIDLRPRDISLHEDTGAELREKYLAAGFKGIILGARNTRTYKDGPFRNSIGVAEHYLKGYEHIFSSHFGRGSTLGANKYIHTKRKYLYKIPLLGGYLLRKKGRKEKSEWISVCKDIINKQQS
ncbi:hypothetical protein COB64_00485 [Candidatus Wolfebacteria bacterium]|nr:MAG: hypothetical protein COB64_00485 [Candidatus Wolfebacteria bacterium]